MVAAKSHGDKSQAKKIILLRSFKILLPCDSQSNMLLCALCVRVDHMACYVNNVINCINNPHVVMVMSVMVISQS